MLDHYQNIRTSITFGGEMSGHHFRLCIDTQQINSMCSVTHTDTWCDDDDTSMRHTVCTHNNIHTMTTLYTQRHT